MKTMNKAIAFLLLTAGLFTGISLSARSAEPVISITLGDIRHIEVHSFETHDFSTRHEMVPPEIVEYARTAIQKDERLNYRSPGEGVLHFTCENSRCYTIKAELTYGSEGPVLWQRVERFRPLITMKEPDGKKFAKWVVAQLAADYDKALRAVPEKIQIREE